MRKLVWAGVGCIVVIVVVGGWNVLAANVLHGDVTPRKLFVSVESESGGGGPFGRDKHSVCRPMAETPRSWRCSIADPSASAGSSEYRVSVHGSCWDASGGTGGLPRKVNGCVHLYEN